MDIKEIINNSNIVICSPDIQEAKQKYLKLLEEDTRVISIGNFANSISVNNWVSLQEQIDITKSDLYNAAIRMNPDTIIIDINGKELIEILQEKRINHIMFAFAYSIEDVLARLETMYMMGSDKSLAEIREQIKKGIDYIIYCGDKIYDTESTKTRTVRLK